MGCSLPVTAPQEQHVHTHEHAVLTAHDLHRLTQLLDDVPLVHSPIHQRALQPNKLPSRVRNCVWWLSLQCHA
jgi:hypothetical protein